MSTGKRQKNNEGAWIIAVDRVEYVLWYDRDGAILRRIRENHNPKMSRRRLAKILISKGHECSHQNIQKIEDGLTKTAPIALVDAICQELGHDLSEVLPMIFIGSQANKKAP